MVTGNLFLYGWVAFDFVALSLSDDLDESCSIPLYLTIAGSTKLFASLLFTLAIIKEARRKNDDDDDQCCRMYVDQVAEYVAYAVAAALMVGAIFVIGYGGACFKKDQDSGNTVPLVDFFANVAGGVAVGAVAWFVFR
jgi:hypothetical protein